MYPNIESLRALSARGTKVQKFNWISLVNMKKLIKRQGTLTLNAPSKVDIKCKLIIKVQPSIEGNRWKEDTLIQEILHNFLLGWISKGQKQNELNVKDKGITENWGKQQLKAQSVFFKKQIVST
ncbi:hypothetical protein Leryth_009264 [Lithospermum erythrorhizon]|nr:hypothetical protein Leryth_009264 [Lithospermum erythrorhizon]